MGTKVAVGADHGGYPLNERVIAHLSKTVTRSSISERARGRLRTITPTMHSKLDALFNAVKLKSGS